MNRLYSFLWCPTRTVLAALFYACLQPALAATELKVMQSSHPLDAYAVGALRVAVAHMEEPYRIRVIEDNFTQTRVIEELKSERVDVMWLASNIEAEESLVPVRFPLLKGLLGFRISIINPKNQSAFRGVRTMNDLRQLSFGQGYGWPDVNILEANGLNVVVTSKYENLFHMTEGGRFDGFPRGVLEPWPELKAHPELGLGVDSEVLMAYTLPFYLFVAPHNRELGQKLHRALDAALADGSFDEYFYGHEMIQGALQQANLQDRQVFRLQNPTLSQQTPLDKPEYWFDITASN